MTPENKTLKPENYNLDPYALSKKDFTRIRQWSRVLMERNEYKFNFHQWKDRDIITAGTVEPESIDVHNIYPFPDLHWIIYRAGMKFNLMLLSGKRMLFVSSFAKI